MPFDFIFRSQNHPRQRLPRKRVQKSARKPAKRKRRRNQRERWVHVTIFTVSKQIIRGWNISWTAPSLCYITTRSKCYGWQQTPFNFKSQYTMLNDQFELHGKSLRLLEQFLPKSFLLRLYTIHVCGNPTEECRQQLYKHLASQVFKRYTIQPLPFI